jgi:hypothetical protein
VPVGGEPTRKHAKAGRADPVVVGDQYSSRDHDTFPAAVNVTLVAR